MGVQAVYPKKEHSHQRIAKPHGQAPFTRKSS